MPERMRRTSVHLCFWVCLAIGEACGAPSQTKHIADGDTVKTANRKNSRRFNASIALSKASTENPKIAIVIDDLGYQLDNARWLAELPYPMTLAIIPGSPFAKRIGHLAAKNRQEVILHVPMETVHTKQWEVGLTGAMSYRDFRDYMQIMLLPFPDVKGVNNHGGSKLTANTEKMDWLMEFLLQQDMFFLDSRTTHHSVAVVSAKKYDVASTARDVFLDTKRTAGSIRDAFNKTRRIARKQGYAIAIGHPYPETLAELKRQLPLLISEGFQLTFCSSLVK